MDNRFVFLEQEAAEPTNNFGERIIRFVVLRRRRSQGTKSAKGNCRVERIISLRQTCRLHMRSSFAVLLGRCPGFIFQRTATRPGLDPSGLIRTKGGPQRLAQSGNGVVPASPV